MIFDMGKMVEFKKDQAVMKTVHRAK